MSDELKQAITLIKSGEKQKGGQILARILKTDPKNETAWLWMSQVVNTKQQQRYCMEQVLAINSNNEIARKFLAKAKIEGQKNPIKETSGIKSEFVKPAPQPRKELSPIQIRARLKLREGVITGVITVLIALVLLFLSVVSLQAELNLQQNGVTTQATVTRVFIRARIFIIQHLVNYQFIVNRKNYYYWSSIGFPFTYLAGKQDINETPSSAMIPYSVWEQASKTGRIEVVYLPNMPWVNRPVAEAELLFSPLNSSIGVILVSIALLKWGIYKFISSIVLLRKLE